ncbi:hypothetical protein [Kitasatospora sp. NPDC090308]|uniref:hypothetical protein n=1 Tax=Kitasatospora sp. NPDC090308 TaxID=3364082 RepID=UPI0038005BC3
MFGGPAALQAEGREELGRATATVALDRRAAVHGAVSMRVDQPDAPRPPLGDQVGRFLRELAGTPPVAAEGTHGTHGTHEPAGT